MGTVALIGFLGGLITGISPCILPVLPVVFFSGLNSTRAESHSARPYLVIAGLVCSFSVVTLAGSGLLSALHLPQDAIRGGNTITTAIGGAQTLHQIVADDTAHRDQLDMRVGKGLQVFSFTFG
jgi:cytochrome c biogenesis protein CcdA